MSKPALVYHYWNDRQVHVWEDWQNPILISIASARAFNPDIPIYVLDVSNHQRNWLDYPHKLNFKCIPCESQIPLLKTNEIYGSSYKICSRQFDIDWLARKIPEDIIISVESDIFWMADPCPLPEPIDRFFFNFYNSGFYYYNKNSDLAKRFLKVWRHYIIMGMSNPKVQAEIMSKYKWDYFQDEAAMVYIVKSFGGMAGPCPDNLNVLFNPFKSWDEHYKNAWNLHLIGAFFPKNRGLLGLMFEPFYEVIKTVLSPQQLYDIYGPDYELLAGKININDIKYTNLAYVKKSKGDCLENVSKLMC